MSFTPSLSVVLDSRPYHHTHPPRHSTPREIKAERWLGPVVPPSAPAPAKPRALEAAAQPPAHSMKGMWVESP